MLLRFSLLAVGAWISYVSCDNCIPKDILEKSSSTPEETLRDYYGKIACSGGGGNDDNNGGVKCPGPMCKMLGRRTSKGRRPQTHPKSLRPAQLRIVNGNKAEKGQWPWMVSLATDGQHVCGGALIKKGFVVTAKHCTFADAGVSQPSDIKVTAGTIKLDPVDEGTTQTQTVAEIIRHPDPKTDIAILKLSGEMTLTADVWPLWFRGNDKNEQTSQLWGPNHLRQAETGEAAIAGWGMTEEGKGKPPSNDLLEAIIKLRHDEPCVKMYGELYKSENQYCAGGVCNPSEENCKEKDSCQGDSGGPLMYFTNEHWVLLGVTSGGDGCARIATPGFYTWTHFIQDWIEKTISS